VNINVLIVPLSGVARVGVTRGGNRRAPKNFLDLFKKKNFAIFSLLHKQLNSSHKISDDRF